MECDALLSTLEKVECGALHTTLEEGECGTLLSAVEKVEYSALPSSLWEVGVWCTTVLGFGAFRSTLEEVGCGAHPFTL